MTKARAPSLHLKYDLPEGLEIGPATNLEDLLAAHHLCHQVYLEEGYTRPNPHNLRLSLHHALPTTTTFVAKFHGQVVGTLMAIADGPFGLPSDRFFDLSSLRARFRRLVEGSGYAIAKPFRGSQMNLLFLLNCYFFRYVETYMAADGVFAAINPKQKTFYNDVLLFDDHITDIVPAASANGAPAVGVILDLNRYRRDYRAVYGGLEPTSNLYHHFFEHQFEQFQTLSPALIASGHPAITPQILSQLFKERWPLLAQLNGEQRQTLRDVYGLTDYDPFFVNHKGELDLIPRREVRLNSIIQLREINGVRLRNPLLVRDASVSGLSLVGNSLMSWRDHEFSAQRLFVGQISVGQLAVDLNLTQIWQKGLEMGLKIDQPPAQWKELMLRAQRAFVDGLILPRQHVKAA